MDLLWKGMVNAENLSQYRIPNTSIPQGEAEIPFSPTDILLFQHPICLKDCSSLMKSH